MPVERTGDNVAGDMAKLGLGKVKTGKKASLPEVLDQDIDERERIALLLEQTLDLKSESERNAKLLKSRLEELAEHAASNGLEGLRTGKVVFTQRLQAGRTGLDTEKFAQELLSRGVTVEVIQACIKAATKTGESFWVRSIDLL